MCPGWVWAYVKVWSNGDVMISTGGKGNTTPVKVILGIFLRVFKAEVSNRGMMLKVLLLLMV